MRLALFALFLALPTAPLAAQGAGKGPPTADARVTRADLARIEGSASARTWVLILSDFQCPVCKEFHDKSFASIRREFVQTGQVRLAYVHFPLRIHPNAIPAAEASMCAAAQDAFWPYHDRIFATVSAWTGAQDPTPHFTTLARELKLDASAFQRCLADDVMLPMIQADYQRGSSTGVNSTPSFLVGDQLIAGLPPIDVLRKAIRDAVAKAR